ncbi:hypothetical protein MIR68_003649 [Amoeboaphelidium protococcarum]|nr:hypothetical protein MIR68_003649 [Amoeboaphelidium protococcarum]
MNLALVVAFTILLILSDTVSAGGSKKKSSSSNKGKKGRNPYAQRQNNAQDDEKCEFQFMQTDNALLATYNPDYIDVLDVQKRVLDGYHFTHEYLISTMNFIRPMINDKQTFSDHILGIDRHLQLHLKGKRPDVDLMLRIKSIANQLQFMLQYPAAIALMSFFDVALEAMLDGRLSRGHIYNLVTNIVVLIGKSLNTLRRNEIDLRLKINDFSQMLGPAYGGESRDEDERLVQAQLDAYSIEHEALRQVVGALGSLDLFDINLVRRSISAAIKLMRGEGPHSTELTRQFSVTVEFIIAYLQLHQILFPAVAVNRVYVEEVKKIYKAILRKQQLNTSRRLLGRGSRASSSTSSSIATSQFASDDRLQIAIDRFIDEYFETTRQAIYMHRARQLISIRPYLFHRREFDFVLPTQEIFKEFSVRVLANINQLVQKYGLKEQDIPHEKLIISDEFSISQEDSSISQTSTWDQDIRLQQKIEQLQLDGIQQSQEHDDKGLVREAFIDPAYKNELNFSLDEDVEYDARDDKVQQDGGSLQEQHLPQDPPPLSSGSIQYFNVRKERCNNLRASKDYAFTLSSQFAQDAPVIFSADEMFTLCQITDGSTKGGKGVKYKEFLYLLSLFRAEIVPLGGSATRISIAMKSRRPPQIHGPHSGNVELGRNILNGAIRVLERYDILPENFEPLDSI